MPLLTVDAARAGHPLPPIPAKTRDLLFSWVLGGIRITEADVRALRAFYNSIGYASDWSKPIYRGMMVKEDGFARLLEGGSAGLRRRVAESWSMNPEIALKFMRAGHVRGGPRIGVMLSMPMPRPGSIVMDVPRVLRTYAGSEQDVPTERYRDTVEQMERFTAECELILTQQCHQCSLDDVEVMSVPWYRGMPDSYRDLLKRHGIDSGTLGRYGPDGAWMCVHDGERLEPFMLLGSNMKPDARFRRLAEPLMRNRPAPLAGDCPALDLRRLRAS